MSNTLVAISSMPLTIEGVVGRTGWAPRSVETQARAKQEMSTRIELNYSEISLHVETRRSRDGSTNLELSRSSHSAEGREEDGKSGSDEAKHFEGR